MARQKNKSILVLLTNEFRLENGAWVNIEYWADARAVHVAAVDADQHQISTAEYRVSIDPAAELGPQLQVVLAVDACRYERQREVLPNHTIVTTTLSVCRTGAEW